MGLLYDDRIYHNGRGGYINVWHAHLETSPSLQVIHNKLFSPLDYTREMAARSYSNLLPLALL